MKTLAADDSEQGAAQMIHLAPISSAETGKGGEQISSFNWGQRPWGP
jgi:hypothetical protein